jgi:hypothetical protein
MNQPMKNPIIEEDVMVIVIIKLKNPITSKSSPNPPINLPISVVMIILSENSTKSWIFFPIKPNIPPIMFVSQKVSFLKVLQVMVKPFSPQLLQVKPVLILFLFPVPNFKKNMSVSVL